MKIRCGVSGKATRGLNAERLDFMALHADTISMPTLKFQRHQLLHELDEFNQRLTAELELDRDAFEHIGLSGFHHYSTEFSAPYEIEPINSRAFASTGVDGVEFRLLSRDGVIGNESPVIHTFPSQGFDGNTCVGETLYDFMCIGCTRGFFSLPYDHKAYQTTSTLDGVGGQVLQRLRDHFGLVMKEGVVAHLAMLKRIYDPTIQPAVAAEIFEDDRVEATIHNHDFLFLTGYFTDDRQLTTEAEEKAQQVLEQLGEAENAAMDLISQQCNVSVKSLNVARIVMDKQEDISIVYFDVRHHCHTPLLAVEITADGMHPYFDE